MPFLKKVKDLDGATAEAVSTDLGLLSDISHPSVDSPEIVVTEKRALGTKYEVTLPQYKWDHALSDEMINITFSEGALSIPQTEKFLKSLGGVVAFNWYCGQGDLNATNVSIYDGECYPFDFDCGFQAIQSGDSFANTREAAFDSVDLDELSDIDGIIDGAIANLTASLKAVLPDVEDALLPLTTPENRAIIRQGFEEQLDKVLDVDDEEISGILDKHLSDDEEAKEQYEEFLSSKRQSALSMSSTHSSERSLEDMEGTEAETEVLDTNADEKTYPSEEIKEALEEFKAEERRDDEALDDQEAADSKDGPRQ